uniref:Zinc knuckle protein n=1 Tax=Siphoviridae sp. ctTPJ4 TaxID=2825519 RepID=A0A8S5V0G7_9CAUD|nr:MAG TPA: zinc knuckle protein [Siphoviridae sp. ctTPJ4]
MSPSSTTSRECWGCGIRPTWAAGSPKGPVWS